MTSPPDWCREIDEPSPVPRLGEIAVPTTIVLGADDIEEIAKIGRTLADGVPHARLTVLADCDHIVPVRQPERLVELILSSART
jgi:pimeloyl-ACP methyl ester carboxylesterase